MPNLALFVISARTSSRPTCQRFRSSLSAWKAGASASGNPHEEKWKTSPPFPALNALSQEAGEAFSASMTPFPYWTEAFGHSVNAATAENFPAAETPPTGTSRSAHETARAVRNLFFLLTMAMEQKNKEDSRNRPPELGVFERKSGQVIRCRQTSPLLFGRETRRVRLDNLPTLSVFTRPSIKKSDL